MAYVLNPNIEPFRKGQSFSSWIKRLGFHFRVNKVNDDQKKDQMFLLGGDYLFSMADKLYPTEEMLDEVSYEILIQKLKEKLDKTDSILLQRYNFSMQVQQPGETASDFIISLKVLAEHCEFGDQKNRLIVDRILVGLIDNSLKHRLLTEYSSKLTLAHVENIIASWEMADIHTKTLKNNDNIDLVASIDNRYSFHDGRQLPERVMTKRSHGFCRAVNSHFDFRSAKDRHHAATSKFLQARRRCPPSGTIHKRRRMDDTRWTMDQPICDYCGRRGHLRRKCYKLQDDLCEEEVNYIPETFTDDADGLSEEVDRLMTIDCGSDGSDSVELECMHVSSFEKSDPCLLNVSIEDNPVQMEVDSGSSVTVMDKNSFNSKFDIPLLKSSKQLVVVNGSRLKVSGEVEVKVEHNNKIAKLNLLVIDCDYQFIPLLGRPWLDEFCPNWRIFFGDLMPVNNILKNQSKTLIADTNPNFSDIVVKISTKTVKHFESDLILTREVPVFKHFYDVPFYFREIIFKCDNRFDTKKSIITINTRPQATADILDNVNKPIISTSNLLNAVLASNNSVALMGNADVCLRFRSKVSLPTIYGRELQKSSMFENNSPVILLDMAKQTKRNTFLLKLLNLLHHGWYADIEQFGVACGLCASLAILPNLNINKRKPSKTPFNEKHTIDFRFKYSAFLLLVRSFSKWGEVNDIIKPSSKIVDFLRLPDLLSDDGISFNSHSIRTCIQTQIIKNSPYNPAENGQKNRLVETVKHLLEKFFLILGTNKLSIEIQITLLFIGCTINCGTLEVYFPSIEVFVCKLGMLILVSNQINYKLHIHEKCKVTSFLKGFSKNSLQIVVGNRAQVIAYPNQIRVVETLETVDGQRSSDQPNQYMEDTKTGRSILTVEQPVMPSVKNEIDVGQIPDRGILSEIIDCKARKRKHLSIMVRFTGLPRLSRIVSITRIRNDLICE
ncbi:uncharacterized protein LOC134285192 [Aedes albopictus]|uniref:CCHC-type domain-containing protein n=1 Tax=Aedes albopictus TaxID=7160 RepID=A0ABM1YCW7_AEDAL